MTAKSENRYKQNSLRKVQNLSQLSATLEVFASGRKAREQQTALPSLAEPRRQRVASWMRGNCSDYDGPTELAQAAFIALWPPTSIDPLGCETHWIWDLAADCFE